MPLLYRCYIFRQVCSSRMGAAVNSVMRDWQVLQELFLLRDADFLHERGEPRVWWQVASRRERVM